jgi:hypothetical protein
LEKRGVDVSGPQPPSIPPFELIHRFAVAMADSSLVPDGLCMTGTGDDKRRLPDKAIVANCMLVADLAYRWEMSPFAVAQCVAIVHGKICVEGKLVHAVLEAKLGVRLAYAFNEGQGDKLGIAVSGTLPGESAPRTVEGTVAAWRTRTSDSPWAAPANWKRQLRYRGAREWARAHAPGVLLGVYTPDEFDDPGDAMRDITPPRAAPLPAPEIPDAPASASAPPVPDVPDIPHDPETGEIKPTDAEFLAQLTAAFATAASEAEVAEHVEANRSEVERRGLEQAASDLAEKRRQRIREIAHQAAEQEAKAARSRAVGKGEPAQAEAYRGVMRAMRNADAVETLAQVWKQKQDVLKGLPDNWVKELEAEKDRLKVKLQRTEGATA